MEFQAYADGKIHECLDNWWWCIANNGYWSLNNDRGEIVCDSLESEDAILLPFTGFTDKDGNKVFKGDLVDPNGGNIKQVVYLQDEFECGFKLRSATGQILNMGAVSEYYEKIGNIYLTPELFK